MKYTLRTAKRPEGFDVDEDRILADDVTFPGEYNPHNVGLWIIGNEYGVLGAVWAGNEQDALDELVDEDLGAALLVDEETVKKATDAEREEWTGLGNAGEYADLTYAWLDRVLLDPAKDHKLMLKLAEARGAAVSPLGKL